MPKKLERKLMGRASAKGYKGKRWKAYVYGTLNRLKKHKRSR